jgi:hypothetical protein
MTETITLKKCITHPIFSLAFFLSACYFLPFYCGSAVTIVASASVLSAYVSVSPELFRSRSGSMMTAICLVVAMWVGAAVIVAMTLIGEIGEFHERIKSKKRFGSIKILPAENARL